MVSMLRTEFSRRSETNGTIVSTCNTCSSTVAVSPLEIELESAERDHVCDPQTLEHWKMFIWEIKRGHRRRPQGQSM